METLPPLDDAMRAHYKALTERPDSEIDYSDIPEWTEEDFKNALHVPAMTKDGSRDWSARVEEAMRKKEKRAISLRIDAAVYDWLKAQGPRYQSRINAILKAYMEAHL